MKTAIKIEKLTFRKVIIDKLPSEKLKFSYDLFGKRIKTSI